MEKAIHESSDKQHILLTGLGTRAIKTDYEWDGERETAVLTPLALVKLMKKRLCASQLPNRVVVLLTDGAKNNKDKTWQTFQKEIYETLGFCPDAVEIPNGTNSEEISRILEDVAKEIPEGAELTLDVTQGFRHFPFIFYTLVLYLTALRRAEIRGAYYGMVEGLPLELVKPIIDLRSLLIELPEWFHAVRMFRDQGTTKPMASLLQPLAKPLRAEGDKLRKEGKKPPPEAIERYKQAGQVEGSVASLEQYAFAYESALPLELEKASRGLIDSIQTLPDIDSQSLPPLVDELTESIVSTAQETAFAKPPPRRGKWKENIPLNEGELKRQAYMIDLYLERGQLSLAVGLMREWVVSWVIWQLHDCTHIENWLDGEVRSQYEDKLHAVKAAARGGALPKGIPIWGTKRFGTFWDELTDKLRNAFHHHAMREDAVEAPPKPLTSVQDFWNVLKPI